MKRILYFAGPVGLGHFQRDVAICKELEKRIENIEIDIVADEPALTSFKIAGFNVSKSDDWIPIYFSVANKIYDNNDKEDSNKYNMSKSVIQIYSKGLMKKRLDAFKLILKKTKYDLVIGDELYEISTEIIKRKLKLSIPFVMIHDLAGLTSVSNSIVDKIIVYFLNKSWCAGYSDKKYPIDLSLFFGEIGTVPDRRFGMFLPNKRDWVNKICKIVGYVLPFDPQEYVGKDKAKLKEDLNIPDRPLIVCCVGANGAGPNLLKLWHNSFDRIKERIPDCQMIIAGAGLKIPHGVKSKKDLIVEAYIHDLYKYFAACDLAVIQNGGGSSTELIALQVPFIYFPVEEMQNSVELTIQNKIHDAGIEMLYKKTNIDKFVETVVQNIGKKVNYKPIQTDGAKKSVELILKLLQT